MVTNELWNLRSKPSKCVLLVHLERPTQVGGSLFSVDAKVQAVRGLTKWGCCEMWLQRLAQQRQDKEWRIHAHLLPPSQSDRETMSCSLISHFLKHELG